MSLKKKYNPEANEANALELTYDIPLSGCCPEGGPENECNYALTFAKSGVSSDSLTAVTIDGTQYTFGSAIDTTGTDAEVAAALRTQIEAVLETNYGRDDGWKYNGGLHIRINPEAGITAGSVRITFYNSQAVLENLRGAGGSPSTHAFVASNCKTL